MLSSLLSLPLTVASSTASLFTSRRRGLTYAVGAVGAAYLAGKWALEKVGESAERARREGWGREDLARRFSLNLQDSQFTVLALLPTLQTQVAAELDVESRTKELAERAKRERENKVREEQERWRREAEEAARVEEERLRAERERQGHQEQEKQAEKAREAQVEEAGEAATPEEAPSSPSAVEPSSSPSPDEPTTSTSADATTSSTLDPTAPSFVFNPSAPAFEPSPNTAAGAASASPSEQATAPDVAAVAATEAKVDGDFPPLSATAAANGMANGNGEEKGEDEVEKVQVDGDASEATSQQEGEKSAEEEGKKSWAAVVQVGVPEGPAGAVKVEGGEKPLTPPHDPDTPPPTAPSSDAPDSSPPPSSSADETAKSSSTTPDALVANSEAEAAGVEEKVEEKEVEETDVEVNPLAEKTKAELWHEIKILAFTRLLTSLYLLPLLTLQTHVQLALLGRGSYVDSLVSSLPPPSPPPPGDKPLPSLPAETANAYSELDLEKALLKYQQLPLTQEEKDRLREEERQDVERKYLTFSWWLLHEGWKVVEQRARSAVEEVVGPMGLKTSLVYGELGALFGQLRRKIELDEETGKAFDFSPALHPPTPQLELQTLISGGSYTPPSPSSSPSPSPTPSSSASYPPQATSPSPSAAPANPISPPLRALLSETSDALDSPDAALIRALMLDKLFSLVIEKLEPSFRSPAAEGEGGRGARFEDVTERTARLAGVLPVLTRMTATAAGEGVGGASVLGTGLEGSEWVEALEDIRELREFSAVLYGSWDREDLRASCVV